MIITEQSAGNSSYFSLSFITTETASCHFSWQTTQIHLHEIWSSVSWFSRDNYAALHGNLWEGKTTLDKQQRRATAFLENKEKRVKFRKVDETSSLLASDGTSYSRFSSLHSFTKYLTNEEVLTHPSFRPLVISGGIFLASTSLMVALVRLFFFSYRRKQWYDLYIVHSLWQDVTASPNVQKTESHHQTVCR